ncbi:GNAT superfamily N-acetyltransferase [Microbacterium ginsengiterrae]|uniref:GNAT superfamily N-acetyltransferase n=1 Tax=Microbacterium ginsengiterrae TaxID=546115 RepID=A0A7W9C9P8_9MICO|nr:GNAT family N-acetyltransferase [Microbacterium ginsengiterrae]MBB5741639.1 GNAT superfamily N-acetyltransferase [Microbacterium ginsengiterrae]
MRLSETRPSDPHATEIVRSYMTEVASRYYGRPASADEIDQALAEEPYDDLHGTSGLLLVVVDDDRPVACAGARMLGDIAELTKVFTLPSHRGRGLSRALLEQVEVACRERGVSVLRLDTRSELAEACALYERLGFEQMEPFNAEPYSDRWYAKSIASEDRP